MINLFIPSRNRPQQLRLLLKSIKVNSPNLFLPYILWCADDYYLSGYEKLQAENLVPAECWHKQTDIIDNFYSFFDICGPNFALSMDDVIFFRNLHISIEDIIEELSDERIFGIILRLGLNTTVHNYLHNFILKKPNIIVSNDKFLWYSPRDYEKGTNYGMWWTFDGAIFKTKEILKLFNNTRFDKTSNPEAIFFQRVENYMMSQYDNIQQKYISIPYHSCCISMNWNHTHNKGNPGIKFCATTQELNDAYLDNYVIDLDSIDFSNIQSCHEELNFSLKRINQ